MATQKISRLRRALRFTIRLILILIGSSLLYVLLCKWIMPPITTTQIGSVIEGYGLHRDYVSWNEISSNAALAAIASEDQLFVEHEGFDWKAIDKSMNKKPTKKHKHVKKGGGASTISQQVAKNVFLWQGGGYFRKGLEFGYTKLIEWVWGKKRIMEVYLNVIEMGPGIYGIEAASQHYFNKPAKNLTRAEAAMIIACLPNPKQFTVKPMSHRVQWRYPQIMRQMDNLEGDDDISDLMEPYK